MGERETGGSCALGGGEIYSGFFVSWRDVHYYRYR